MGICVTWLSSVVATPTQVLHVVRHLPWYAVVAPSRLGDWAIVLHNTLNLSFTCTLLLLAACPRSGVVWAWWQR